MVDRSRRIKYTDEQVVQAYKELKSAMKVAKQLGIGGTTVERILAKHKVVRDGRQYYLENVRAYTDEQEAEIVKKYNAGTWVADLVAEYGATAHSIHKVLDKNNCIKRQNPAPTLTDEELREIERLHNSGLGQMKISLKLGRSQTFISSVMKRHGIPVHNPIKHTHGSWKGGRQITGDGYIRVRIERSDPYFTMANCHGYILEHRYVMAKKLGRLLKETETVHHIDGKKANNNEANLQLRQGKHGKGTVLHCLDCLSENVGHKPIGGD